MGIHFHCPSMIHDPLENIVCLVIAPTTVPSSQDSGLLRDLNATFFGWPSASPKPFRTDSMADQNPPSTAEPRVPCLAQHRSWGGSSLVCRARGGQQNLVRTGVSLDPSILTARIKPGFERATLHDRLLGSASMCGPSVLGRRDLDHSA
jgi:hypothetical protein